MPAVKLHPKSDHQERDQERKERRDGDDEEYSASTSIANEDA